MTPTHQLKFFDNRLGDDDRYYLSGLITVASAGEDGPMLHLTSYNPDSEREYSTLTMRAFGKIVRIILPPIIRPHKVKQAAKYWSEEDKKRMGRDWYWKYFTRKYGFSFWEDSVHLYYGLQSGDSLDKPKTAVYFLPWKELRFVRHTVYDLHGNVYKENKDYKNETRHVEYEDRLKTPKATFDLIDLHDGTPVKADLMLEECEWRLGTGVFKFLSYFTKPLIRRRFEVEFSSGVGADKGGWKGGVIGMSVDALPGELHQEGVDRLCREGVRGRGNRITYLAPASGGCANGNTEPESI